MTNFYFLVFPVIVVVKVDILFVYLTYGNKTLFVPFAGDQNNTFIEKKVR